MVYAAAKYKDEYSMGSADTQDSYYRGWSNIKGDAVYETSNVATYLKSWNNDSANVPFDTLPFFTRGSCWEYGSSTGIFAFSYSNGAGDSHYGYRPVLSIP